MELSLTELPGMNVLQRLPATRWRQILVLVGLIWALWWAARLTWLIYDGWSWAPPSAASSSAPVLVRKSVDIKALVDAHLLGNAEAPVADTNQEIAETTVALKLVGVYGTSDERKASAIVQEPGGPQTVVFIGESMPGNSGTLKQVFADRVVFDRGGRLETLRMEDGTTAIAGMMQGTADGAGQNNGVVKTGALIDKRKDAYVTQQLTQLRGQLQTDPNKLADVIRLQPNMDASGKVNGYRLSPGKDRKMFARFGLQNNDLVRAINGVALDNPTSAMDLLNDLQNASEFQLTLERGGQPLDVLVSLSPQ